MTDYTAAFQKALPMLQACLDCVVVVAKNEPVVKNIMAFLRCVCIESNRFSSSSPAEEEVDDDDDDEVAEAHPLALWLMAYALACSKAANKVVRMRGCELGSIVMGSFPEETDLSEELFENCVQVILFVCAVEKSSLLLLLLLQLQLLLLLLLTAPSISSSTVPRSEWLWCTTSGDDDDGTAVMSFPMHRTTRTALRR